MKILTSQFRNCTKLLLLMVLIFILILACNPVEQPYNPVKYFSPVDIVWKSIANLELSYHYLNLNEYIRCFRSDFEFNYKSNGDTLSWGYDTEQEIHQLMFNQVDEVWLTVLGNDQYPWSGDTTGATLVLPRDYYLRVFIGPDDSTGTPAYGTAHFICRQDSMEEWYVWQWWDFPDTGKEGWGDIKVLFMTPPSTH